MALVPVQAQFLRHVCKLIERVYKDEFMVTGGYLYRSHEEQQVMVITGKSQTMNSMHRKRLAIDLNFFKPNDRDGHSLTYVKEDIEAFGKYWEGLHPDNKWGGNWVSLVDTCHFERRV